jgi:hypothetical protein
MSPFFSTFRCSVVVGRAAAVAVGILGVVGVRDARADDVIGSTSDAPSADATALGTGAGASASGVAPPGKHTYELGAHADYTMAPIRGGTNPFGVGFGARIGFRLSNVYAGANVVSYLGGTDVDTSETALLLGGEAGYDVGTPLGSGWLTIRPQVGVGGVQITRTDPSLLSSSSSALSTRTAKLGKPDVITQATRSSPAPISSGSSGTTSAGGGGGGSSSGPSDKITVSNVYVQPGVSAVYSADLFFVGMNANYLIVPGLNYGGYSTSWFAFGVQGQAGLRW